MSGRRILCVLNTFNPFLCNRLLSSNGRLSRSLTVTLLSRDFSNRDYHIRQKKKSFKKLKTNFESKTASSRVPLAVKILANESDVIDEQHRSGVVNDLDDKLLRLDEVINEYETLLEAKNLHVGAQDPQSASVDSPNDGHFVPMYGTPDPSIPKSEIPCQGCGAVLHCQDPAIPGYLPSQKFIILPLKKLKHTFCQRCVLMKKHNIALGVKLTAKDYAEVISKIRNTNGLVVLVVDLMDMPNSIFPGLAELVGPEKPIYLVGNKVDLLPKDKSGYLQHCKDTMVRMCKMSGVGRNRNIQHISLVSAKTKYGIEELITHLMKQWARQGDVYIVGCTNVGKSTLYNALLSSDYCKSTARDLLARATTCVWPGTTLNLLKFPIVDPTQWRLAQRAQRLLKVKSSEQEENKLRKTLLKDTKKLQHASLMGHLGVTEEGTPKPMADAVELFTPGSYTLSDGGIVEDGVGQHPTAEFDPTLYTQSRWCFDTPGAVNSNQIINMCTHEELEVLLMTKLVRPRTCVMKPGDSLWVSGLARIDYLEGPTSVYFTTLAPNKIPLHVVRTEEAEVFYRENLGTKFLGIPLGDEERLKKLPPLEGTTYTLKGLGWKESIADIVLSSLGWVSVTAGTGMEITVKGFTPNKLGLFHRSPCLLPFAVNLRGKRIRNSKMYNVRQAKFGSS